MLTRTLRPIVFGALGIFVLSSCRNEETAPAYPVLSTDYRLTSVAAMAPGNATPDPLPFWRAEYYPDGRIKSLSDDRDSSYVAYSYAGSEIIGQDISAHDHWPPFTSYRLKLNDQRQVVQLYRMREKDGGGWYDTTAYTYDQVGYVVAELHQSAYLDRNDAETSTTTAIAHELSDGNPVISTATTDFRSPTGTPARQTSKIIKSFYPDKPDKNNIQAFFRLYGYAWPVHHVPFHKPAAHLLRKVTYVDPDGSTIGEREFTYAWDDRGNVIRITEKASDGTALYYQLRYN